METSRSWPDQRDLEDYQDFRAFLGEAGAQVLPRRLEDAPTDLAVVLRVLRALFEARWHLGAEEPESWLDWMTDVGELRTLPAGAFEMMDTATAAVELGAALLRLEAGTPLPPEPYAGEVLRRAGVNPGRFRARESE